MQVSALPTNYFIFALKRFIGRRGVPQKKLNDNATNFVGADRKLRELKEPFLAQAPDLGFAAKQGFAFGFIKRPIMGGGGEVHQVSDGSRTRQRSTYSGRALNSTGRSGGLFESASPSSIELAPQRR